MVQRDQCISCLSSLVSGFKTGLDVYYTVHSECFKVFVENGTRIKVYTYPFTVYGAQASEPIDDRLVKALITCLIRKPSERQKVQMSRLSKPIAANVLQTSLKQSQIMKSSRKRSLKPIHYSIERVKFNNRTPPCNKEDVSDKSLLIAVKVSLLISRMLDELPLVLSEVQQKT